MADQVAASHDGDAAGFSSATSSLVPGDREEFDLHVYASDMLLVVQSNSDDAAARVLHLKNVRESTLAEAQTSVNSFFDQFEPLNNGPLAQCSRCLNRFMGIQRTILKEL